ncbi:unnamed protein product [Microthlaspi erraticum]|uniref:Uncharacterized protein n=1 Tax=Microthlaspi erraticum TaxID=1685480 RepID=A0A6D2JMA9_9BRAS|nr:unnamed protein product [Microthlaspi erraticum]
MGKAALEEVSPFLDKSLSRFQVQGLNSHSRQGAVMKWIGNNKPLLGGILDTHVKEDRVSVVLASVFLGWRFDCNYSNLENGRILVVWDLRYRLSLLRNQLSSCYVVFIVRQQTHPSVLRLSTLSMRRSRGGSYGSTSVPSVRYLGLVLSLVTYGRL